MNPVIICSFKPFEQAEYGDFGDTLPGPSSFLLDIEGNPDAWHRCPGIGANWLLVKNISAADIAWQANRDLQLDQAHAAQDHMFHLWGGGRRSPGST